MTAPREYRDDLHRDGFALSRLWAARSVAVVGASDKPGALGRLPVEYLQRYGYAGDVYPVRPDGAPVAGLPSYPSLRDCPAPVDLAMIMVSADLVPGAVDDCAAADVPIAIICASGFAETGPDGAQKQANLVHQARAGGVRVIGPNCIGTVGVERGVVTSFSPLFAGDRTELVPGSIGFVSQSGALGYGAVSLAFERGLGLGWVATTGNEADVTALEIIEHLVHDPQCAGVLGIVERLDDRRRLERIAGSGVPVALLVAGRTAGGQRAAASHTGALATDDRVVSAALRQFGIARAEDVEELLDLGDAFAQPRRTRGRGVAVITTSGGSGILAADAVDAYGLELAELAPDTLAALEAIVPAYGAVANPVDVTATVMRDPALVQRSLDVIVDDPAVDAVIACFCVLTAPDVAAVADALSIAAERSGKSVLAARTGADHLAPLAARALRDAGIPAYPTPARAVRALAGLVETSQDRSAPSVVRAGRAAQAGQAVPADEVSLKALLARSGVRVPNGRLAADALDATAAVAEVGGRAVLKAVVPGLLHKSEVGAVVVGVTADAAPAAYERLAVLGGSVLVEEMISGGVEALVGVSASPLGPVLALGVGGTLTEIVDDVALRLLPTHVGPEWIETVETMIHETRLHVLLGGTRGAGPYDRDALVALVVRVCETVSGWPDGFELDLNPVAVLPVLPLSAGGGAVVLDAAYSRVD